MKNVVYAFMIGLCLLAVPAAAFETPIASEKGKAILQKMGTDLQPIAARFGCTDFAWANFVDGGKVAALEFVPQGHKVEKWTRMVSMAVYALPGKPDEDKKALTALSQTLLAGYAKNGKIIRKQAVANAKGEPGLFLEYTIGDGAEKEHNAGVFFRLTKSTASFIQIQSRGKALAAEDAEKIKSLLMGTAKPAAKSEKNK